MIAGHNWPSLLADELGLQVLRFVARPWFDCLGQPSEALDSWMWRVSNCPRLCRGDCVMQMNRIPEGVDELEKCWLASQTVGGARRLECARHWYLQWHHAWAELQYAHGTTAVITTGTTQQRLFRCRPEVYAAPAPEDCDRESIPEDVKDSVGGSISDEEFVSHVL